MSVKNGWLERNALVVHSAFMALACATAIDDPVPFVEFQPVGTAGDATAGSSAEPSAGTAGSGKGGMGAGGAGMAGAGKGGTGTSGAGTGSAGTDSAGMSGAGAGSAGLGNAGKGGTGTGVGGATGGAGQGGTGGGAGKAGTGGGTSGTGGNAGKGGATSGGSTGSGGTGNVEEADGCARLSVPLNGASDKAHFTISLGNATDLGDPGTTISLRIYVEAGTGGVIFAYAQDADYNFLGPASRPSLEDQSGWVTLRWNVASEPTVAPALDKSNVRRIGIEINAEPSTSWSNPTVVFVDSISVDSELSFDFDTSGTVSTSTNQTSDPSSQVLWINADSSDTTASGTALSWVPTCP